VVKLALADDLVARVNRLAVLVDLAQELLVTRIIGSSTYITGNRKEGQGKTGKPMKGRSGLSRFITAPRCLSSATMREAKQKIVHEF